MQQVLSMVDPFGEERADLRAAISTRAILEAVTGASLSGQERLDLLNELRFYLKLNEPEQTHEVGPAAMRQALGE